MATTAIITVTAKDTTVNQNPVPNAIASFTSSGTNNSFTPPSGVTNALGMWSSSFSSSKAENKIISASLTHNGNWVRVTNYAYVLVNAGLTVSPSLSLILSSSASIEAS